MEILCTVEGTVLLMPDRGRRAENVYLIGPYSVDFFPFIDAATELYVAPNVYIVSYEYASRLIREKHTYPLVVLPIDLKTLPEDLQQMAALLYDDRTDVETLRQLYNQFIKEYDRYRKQ